MLAYPELVRWTSPPPLPLPLPASDQHAGVPGADTL